MSERPIDIWREKLEFFRREEATASDPSQRFTIQKQIREAKQKIAELEAEASGANESHIRESQLETQAGDAGTQKIDGDDSDFDVFLSHNSKDKPAVEELALTLKGRGVHVWLDAWELIPGRPWQEALEQIIQTTRSAAVVVGKDGLGPWEEPEMRACISEFVNRKLPVIPVLLPDAGDKPQLPLFLRAFTWVDLRGGLSPDGIDRLVWGITGKKPDHQQAADRQSAEPAAHVQPERLAEWTASAKDAIARGAQAWLECECAPFVVPSLSRQPVEPAELRMKSPQDQKQPLADEEIQNVVLGKFGPQNRVRIIGDSGMGKTALLHYCQRQIARQADGRLPLRVDRLAAFDWKRNQHELLASFAESLLHAYLPEGISPEQRLEWLQDLVAGGKVVFLLDALDQTDEQLSQAGLSRFLRSDGVVACPVIITLRPEVAGSDVFAAAAWDTITADGFRQPQQQREYLRDVADVLLPGDEERWDDEASFERKQQWADLLEIPLLLKMLRDLARAERQQQPGVSLSHLPNRYAVYREAVAYLVRQGLRSVEASTFRGRLYDAGEVDDRLIDIGWVTIAQGEGNFSAVLAGRPFRKLRRSFQQDKDVLLALQQVDVITRHSVLDHPGEAGLAWRHRSFSEYFAGRHLALADAAEQLAVAERHAHDPRWEWVFRFALSEIDAEDRESPASDTHLARVLMQCGNPFVVYEAVDRDGLELPAYLERLCRWLVHRDWSLERDYTDAWQESTPPNVDERWIEILESLFERQHRDSRYLHAAWELVEGSSENWAVGIRECFLGEFREMLENEKCAESATARQLAAGETFARCPPTSKDDGKPFEMGSRQKEEGELIGETPQHSIRVTPFQLQRTPVSNVQLELFDPSHRSRRDQYSPDDDNPAIWVSWYMADMFSKWLGESYRLPTEAEWEFAARAGTTTRYWWGDDFDGTKCHSGESDIGHTLPPDASRANPWGLVDMLGNVWEWCLDGPRDYSEQQQRDPLGPLDVGSDRVSRGGSWFISAGFCRSAFRSRYTPAYRIIILGFRLALVPSSQEKGDAEPAT